MGESARNEKLPLISGRKNDALPLTVGFTVLAKIDGYIKDRAGNDAHELRLRMFNLKVQTAQDAPGAGRLVS